MIQYAFVIKNFIPLYKKVQILHPEHGKIMCMYSNNHSAAQLTTGSIIACHVESSKFMYQFEYLEIIQSATYYDFALLEFIHEIVKIVVYLVPDKVAISDIFEHIMHVHSNIAELSVQGRQIALLRLYLMCDVLPVHPQVYTVAMQDPFSQVLGDQKMIDNLLRQGRHAITEQRAHAL